ncbi:hypothetical protein ACQEU5_12210 [Marinactinospora thermotolerans]|uniref:hypothetical protein n=1 Tax=Marinactinospora thermotolerans TaxID=531310 RepID=UPI003D9319D0
MAERGNGRSAKRGLRGWRAALVVVGAGVLAAFLMVGIVVGAVNLLLSSFTSPPPVEAAYETREPRETTEVGVLDLCELVQTQSLMSSSPFNRVDEGDDYRDTAADDPNLAPRTVSDSCTWDVPAGGGGNWKFSVSYIAYMSDGDEQGKGELAEGEFSREVDETRGGFSPVIAEGELGSVNGQSRYFYGDSSGRRSYGAVRQVKSGVYVIRVSQASSGSSTEPTSEQEFRVAVQKVLPYLDRAFERQIPD